VKDLKMLLLKTNRQPTESAEIDSVFRGDVLEGLSRLPRAIPARWLYDERGSELFEEITLLPEYYPTRTERAILEAHARAIANCVGGVRTVVEFGSGSSCKTPTLLSAVNPSTYVPVDISGEFLRKSAVNLAASFPRLHIHPIEQDFTSPVLLPPIVASGPRLGFFAGSTIGNLTVPAAVDLLRTFVRTLGKDGMLLIGIDRVKDAGVLVPAYDDAQGVTAEFNLNLLHRINRELRGTMPVEAFRHIARWNAADTRMEMHLAATRDIYFEVDGYVFSMAEGESIHTENSHKYGSRDACVLLRAGGWNPVAEWTDEHGLFALYLAAAAPAYAAP
jgi:L-histidine N-alpha-methyltransferase